MYVCVFCICVVGQQPVIDELTFKNLINSNIQRVHDVSFVYEGSYKYLGIPLLDAHQKPKPSLDSAFQGLYLLRADGSILIDLFEFGVQDPRPMRRTTSLLVADNLTTVTRFPDLKNREKASKSRGGPGSLNTLGSPHALYYLWYFLGLEDLNERNYEFIGWETIAGHNCLNVRINFSNVENKEKFRWKFWFDVERGCHPLRVDFEQRGRLVSRTDGVELSQIRTADGRLEWIPVKGSFTSYLSGRNELSDSPVFSEDISVVNSSVRVNETIPDSKFDVFNELKSVARSELRGVQTQFAAIPVRRARSDARGVQENLAKRLLEANAQAKELEATYAAAGWSWIEDTLPLVCYSVAMLTLSGVLVLMWANRRRKGNCE